MIHPGSLRKDLVGSVLAGLVPVGLVPEPELVGHLGLWCQYRQPSNSRKNMTIPDVRS
jgi:hypothetical protein